MDRMEALAQGLHYTGMSFSYSYKRLEEQYKDRVKKLKKEYKVRLVLVDEGNGYRAYYGDDNYFLIQDAMDAEVRVNKFQQSLDRLKAEYEERVRQLTEKNEKDLEHLKKVAELRK